MTSHLQHKSHIRYWTVSGMRDGIAAVRRTNFNSQKGFCHFTTIHVKIFASERATVWHAIDRIRTQWKEYWSYKFVTSYQTGGEALQFSLLVFLFFFLSVVVLAGWLVAVACRVDLGLVSWQWLLLIAVCYASTAEAHSVRFAGSMLGSSASEENSNKRILLYLIFSPRWCVPKSKTNTNNCAR